MDILKFHPCVNGPSAEHKELYVKHAQLGVQDFHVFAVHCFPSSFIWATLRCPGAVCSEAELPGGTPEAAVTTSQGGGASGAQSQLCRAPPVALT